MAQRGDMKKVYLENSTAKNDSLYVRIAGFCQDEKATSSENGKMAGITFVAVNSINNVYYYDELIKSYTTGKYS